MTCLVEGRREGMTRLSKIENEGKHLVMANVWCQFCCHRQSRERDTKKTYTLLFLVYREIKMRKCAVENSYFENKSNEEFFFSLVPMISTEYEEQNIVRGKKGERIRMGRNMTNT